MKFVFTPDAEYLYNRIRGAKGVCKDEREA